MNTHLEQLLQPLKLLYFWEYDRIKPMQDKVTANS